MKIVIRANPRQKSIAFGSRIPASGLGARFGALRVGRGLAH
jgi:hypothetical protein